MLLEMFCVLVILSSPRAVCGCVALGLASVIHSRWRWWFVAVVFSLEFDLLSFSMVPSSMNLAMAFFPLLVQISIENIFWSLSS